jgi:shikimate kinase
MKIFLIGYRCTGKTTVGRMLARRLGSEFMDTDQYICKDAGMTIQQIVELSGWGKFRELEKKALFSIQNCMDDMVVATGGGTVLDPDNRSFINEYGKCIWLDADPETIAQRMASDPATRDSRPNLKENSSISGEILTILSQRRSLYKKTADIKISVKDYSPEQVVTMIIRRLE